MKIALIESSVAVTVLSKKRSRNLILQMQRIWTRFRRTKNDSLWRLRLSGVRGPGKMATSTATLMWS